MWSVFKLTERWPDGTWKPGEAAAEVAAQLLDLETRIAADDVIIRGWYDLSGLRADADLLVWWHAPSSDALQDAYIQFGADSRRPPADAGLVADGAAPAGGVQQEPRPGVPGR